MPYFQRFTSLAATLSLAAAICPDHSSDWCGAMQATLDPEMSEQEAADRAAIEAHPVCIGSRVWSAGTMADTVYYHYRRHGDQLTVGYFVYWSTERPWGSNNLTYGVLPALFVDAFYSHTFFLLPGARELLYGPGDIEGASVTYRRDPVSGELAPIGGIADDDRHKAVTLSAEDLDASGRTALVTDVWSHQLGGKGGARLLREVFGDDAGSAAEPAVLAASSGAEAAVAISEENDAQDEDPQGSGGRVRCFSGDALRPLPEAVKRTFRLGSADAPRRAKPAWRLEAVHGTDVEELAPERVARREDPGVGGREAAGTAAGAEAEH